MSEELIKAVALAICKRAWGGGTFWQKWTDEAQDAIRAAAPHYEDRIEALTAENERLREALGKVRFLAQVNYEQNDNLNSRGRRDLLRIAECARAALGDTQ